MSRRDLSLIGMGAKARYDAWPHTRVELLNLRDFAQTEEQLDEVARIADKFDAEDAAWNEASKAVQRAQGHQDALDRYSAFNFANLVGYASMVTFEADRRAGIIPPPDGVLDGFPYWRRATIEKFKGGER